jgi:hypothetical protein
MSTVTAQTQTEQLTEEDMVTRTEVNASCVSLITLEPGDTFETDDASGTVVWKVNHGSAKAVEVLFEGATVPLSIAPSLLVRKTGSILQEQAAAPSVPATAPPVVPVPPVVVTVPPVVEAVVEAVVEVPPPPVVEAVVEAVVEVPPAPVVEAVVEAVVEVPPAPVVEAVVEVPPAPAPVVAAPVVAVVRPVVVRVVPIALPVPNVTAKPKAVSTSAAPAVVATQAATDLTAEQVAALPAAVTQSLRSLFTYGLLNGWSKGSYWLCTQKYFPTMKAGSAYKSCCDQINLYRSELRKQGRLQ